MRWRHLRSPRLQLPPRQRQHRSRACFSGFPWLSFASGMGRGRSSVASVREASDWCMKSVSGDNGSVTAIGLPGLKLASVEGSPVRLGELLADSVSVVLFVTEECPTCAMTLRRLAAPAGDLAAAGITAIAIFEDPLEVAARTARASGFPGTVLSEPEPYELSRSFELQSVPTTMLFDSEGRVLRRVVGWDREGLDDLLAQASALAGAPALQVSSEAPDRKPGCGAKSEYGPET